VSKLGLSGVRGWRTALVVLVVLGLVGTLATGAGAASKRSKASKRVARAASAFANQDSARVSGSIDVEIKSGRDAGERVEFPFSGSVDNRTLSGSFTFDLSGLDLPSASGSFEEILTDGALYVSIGSLNPKIEDALGGKHWVKVETKDIPGFDSQTDETDPSSTLDGLRGVSNIVDEVGRSTVRGVDTTHYRATIDVGKALTQVPPTQRDRLANAFSKFKSPTIPVDVCIDSDGLPRKYALTIDVTQKGGTAHLRESFEFYDYGVSVRVKAPPADDVADYSELKDLERTSQAS
jgi:hypothetical protein